MSDLTNREFKPVVLKSPVGFEYYDYDEIIMFRANRNNSYVYLVSAEKPLLSLYSLLYIEKSILDKTDSFHRCHKSYIVNLMHVERLVLKDRLLCLANNMTAPISESKLKEFIRISGAGREK